MESVLGHEDPPNMIDRRKLLAVLGAGVLVVAAGYTVWGPSERESTETYPLHENVVTTVFWVGEEANLNTNDNIHNNSSAWANDWEAAFGGEDDPSDRCGYVPCDFEPKENPFYFALPFGDYTEDGLKSDSELQKVPWYTGSVKAGESILKNRWIEITYQGKKAYAQWQDVGPFNDDDADYVFGTAEPKDPRAGLDVSPAVADYFDIDGRGETSWRFIEESAVPPGPWREVVTASGPQW